MERPFRDRLRQIGWNVINHTESRGSVPAKPRAPGPAERALSYAGIPQNPATSLRGSFREAILIGEFRASLKRINLTEDGRSWPSEKQIDDVLRQVVPQSGLGLLEANRAVHTLLTKNTTTDRNELTGERSPLVRLVDFRHPERNSFIAINQFRVDTPGGCRDAIIPDIVLFVNGLPLVVVECKDTDLAEPLSEAFIQIRRYANARDDDYGVKEGEERLFHANLFSIITHGGGRGYPDWSAIMMARNIDKSAHERLCPFRRNRYDTVLKLVHALGIKLAASPVLPK